MMAIPRWIHRCYARLFGYFWLPCNLCGAMTGGHEWRDIDGQSSSIPDPLGGPNRVGICPACTRAGKGTPRGFAVKEAQR